MVAGSVAAPHSQDGGMGNDAGSTSSNERLLTGYPVSVSGMITVPVQGGPMYQTVVANIQQIHQQSDGTMQVRLVKLTINIVSKY
jgi:hypothetical protein